MYANDNDPIEWDTQNNVFHYLAKENKACRLQLSEVPQKNKRTIYL